MSLPSHVVQGLTRIMLILFLAFGLVGCFESLTGPEFPLPGEEVTPIETGSEPGTGGDPGDPGTGGPSEPPGGDPGQPGEPPPENPPPENPPPENPPPENPPPQNPPPDPHSADPPGMIGDGRLVNGGYWNEFWTGSPSKLSDDAQGNGVNQERNATIRWLGGIAGVEDPDQFLGRGRIRFQVKVNADGLETGGGGKHLINLASTPLSRGRRDLRTFTRVEIANPGDAHPRFVLHNYVNGSGGAKDLGNLPFSFQPDQWVEIDWSWELNGRQLRMVCNGRTFETTLLAGSEGPGRYWGSGHMETNHGGGKFTFSRLQVTRN